MDSEEGLQFSQILSSEEFKHKQFDYIELSTTLPSEEFAYTPTHTSTLIKLRLLPC